MFRQWREDAYKFIIMCYVPVEQQLFSIILYIYPFYWIHINSSALQAYRELKLGHICTSLLLLKSLISAP